LLTVVRRCKTLLIRIDRASIASAATRINTLDLQATSVAIKARHCNTKHMKHASSANANSANAEILSTQAVV
jgi:hypothetical protein